MTMNEWVQDAEFLGYGNKTHLGVEITVLDMLTRPTDGVRQRPAAEPACHQLTASLHPLNEVRRCLASPTAFAVKTQPEKR